MKKYFGYLMVGLFSATFAVLGMKFFSSNNSSDNPLITHADRNNGAFSFVDYNGNYTATVPDFVSASQKTVNAVVSINNFSTKRSNNRQYMDPFEFFFGYPDQQRQEIDPDKPTGMGSGVIISPDGYIVTNNHVIKGSDKIEVVLNNQKSYIAELVGTDPNTDIALIKVDAKDLPFVKFVDSDGINVGDWVLAVGNPFGLNSTVTAGIVSAKGRSIDILRRNANNPIESFIQTDAAINPGNSGGALVNPNGDLVGINTAISSPTGTFSGYGFAIPSNLVKKVVEDIKKYGIVQRGYLGVQGLDLNDEFMLKDYNKQNGTNYKNQQGVLVQKLVENGGALAAGIEKGDIITEIDGQKISSFGKLSFAVGSKYPGDKVEVKLLRDGKEKVYTVTLRDQNGNTKRRSISDLTVAEKLGAEFEPLTERQKVSFGIDYGVMVKNIQPGSKLNGIGIDNNFIILKVNDKEVNDQKDIEKILKSHKGKVSISYVDPYGRIYTRGFTID
ncbi:MAG: Do family serine endopeptidase [Weeksellaceae bacterium]